MRTRLILISTLLTIGLVSSLGSAQANADALIECTVYAQAQIDAWVNAKFQITLVSIRAWVSAGASAAASAYAECEAAAKQTLSEASSA